jgi:hypothetical protein
VEATAAAAQARARAQQVREAAQQLLAEAFAEEAHAAANQVLAIAAQAEAQAAALWEARRREALALADRPDLAKLLDERRRAAAADVANATAAARSRRRSEARAAARQACARGQFAEARALLATVADDASNGANAAISGEVAALRVVIARRERDVKLTAAVDALRIARRHLKHTPDAVVAALAGLDLDGVPEELCRQVFGVWIDACIRVCHARRVRGLLRRGPVAFRAAVLAAAADGTVTVLSALGMGSGWCAGAAVAERDQREARPLQPRSLRPRCGTGAAAALFASGTRAP